MAYRSLSIIGRIAAFGALLGWAVPAQAQTTYTDGVVAVINSEVITVFDVALFALQGEQDIRSRFSREDLRDDSVREEMIAQIENLRKEAANRLIDQKLIYAEFAGRGLTVPDELIEKRMDRIVSSPQFNGDVGAFEDYLEQQETSVEEFRETITKSLAVNLLTRREVDRRVIVTPQEVQQFYLENREKLSRPERIRLGMLEIKHARHSDHEERVKKVADGLAAGKDFGKVVAEYSDGPNKTESGDLGWQALATMRPEFREALGGFAGGTVSAPVPLGGSTYFFKVLEAEAVQQASFDSLQPRLEAQLRMRERERLYRQWVEKLRQKAYVRVFFK